MAKSSPQLSIPKKSVKWAALWATAPLDKPKAESVILRSTDNIYFNVCRGILREASPIFEDMFALSSPATNVALSLCFEDEMIDGVPVILMHETSFVIDFLLRLEHPSFAIRRPQTVDDAFGILSAARKFLIPRAQRIAKAQFIAYAKKEPIRVYATACRLRLPDEMRIAAKAFLTQTLADTPELDDISSIDYRKLLQYRSDGVAAVMDAVQPERNYGPLEFPWLTSKCWFAPMSSERHEGWTRVQFAKSPPMRAPPQFITYMRHISESLVACPDSQAVFDEQLSEHLFTAAMNSPCLWRLVIREIRQEVLSCQEELSDAIDNAV